MRNYEFPRLWRSTVGFDRVFDLVNSIEFSETQNGYPPYDVARTGDESYRV